MSCTIAVRDPADCTSGGSHRPLAAPTALAWTLAWAVDRAGDTLHMWLQRSRQRRALAELDDRLLADVGIAADDAAREVAKPFWQR